jgi:hypothetical protein
LVLEWPCNHHHPMLPSRFNSPHRMQDNSRLGFRAHHDASAAPHQQRPSMARGRRDMRSLQFNGPPHIGEISFMTPCFVDSVAGAISANSPRHVPSTTLTSARAQSETGANRGSGSTAGRVCGAWRGAETRSLDCGARLLVPTLPAGSTSLALGAASTKVLTKYLVHGRAADLYSRLALGRHALSSSQEEAQANQSTP